MPGYVQMLNGLDDIDLFDNGVADLGDISASDPPPLLVGAVQGILHTEEVRAYLRGLGRFAANRAIGNLLSVAGGKPTPPSPWMKEVFEPILEPVYEGILEVLAKKSRPWLYGLAGLAALGAFGFGALVGRKRCR